MATSREERMQQRMRGAGRHEVADDSFGFVLPVAETSPDPSPSLPQPRSEPNTSAKRRRLNDEPGPVNPQPSSASTATRSPTRLSGGQEPTPTNPIAPRLNSPPTTATRISARLSTLNLNQDGTPRNSAIEDAPRDLPAAEIAAGEPQGGSDGPRQPTPRPNSRASEASEAPSIFIQSMIDLLEEVTESPVTAPGSGRRRRIEPTEALTQSAKLQRMVMAEEEAGFGSDLATSSPLARKTRQSMATVGTLSTRTTRASVRKTPSSPIEALHGSSPLARHSRKSNSTMLSGSARSMRSQERRSSPGTVAFDAGALSSPPDAVGTSSPIKPQLGRKKPETIPESPYEIEESEDDNQQAQAQAQVQVEVEAEAEAEAEADHEKAQEVDDHEAAQRIGQKRRRVSPRQRRSPDAVDDADPPTLAIERPARKRQARHKISPAKQSQPKPIKRKKKPPARRKSDGDSIPVTVQRYTKPLRRNDSDADEDILNADIPFTDHKSPNVIDVVLQMCEESLDKYLSTLHEEASQADGSANRKIYRIKLRTVEAFQEELRTQLQAQTIALDNLRTLKKRVKAAQKEKISLRNEILRIRAEREQVSLKIDAVRMRHETANKDSLNQLGLSSAMDDVELVIENGKMAPELNSKERKMAGLANLDLLISQITNQVSAVGEAGGALKQIKDFNMFLERAAIALEGR